MASSLRPFCAEITQPSALEVREQRARGGLGVVRLGREDDRVPLCRVSVSGVNAGTRCVNSSIGPGDAEAVAR